MNVKSFKRLLVLKEIYVVGCHLDWMDGMFARKDIFL